MVSFVLRSEFTIIKRLTLEDCSHHVKIAYVLNDFIPSGGPSKGKFLDLSLFFFFFSSPLTRFYSVAQVSLEFTAVPLPQSSKCWVCRCEPSQLAGSLPFCLIQCVIYKSSCHILVHFRFHITYFISQVPFLPLAF